MGRSIVRRARLWAAGAMAAAGVVGLAAAPASAWTGGNVWVNLGSWNCPAGGSVVGVYWAVDAYSSGPAGGDWGDNVIYPRVRVGAGAHNTLSYQTICKKWGWYTYRGVVGQRSLTPYKSGLSYTY
ncbi:hypothetical protein OG613_15550 [Streptomyces sp. NBC_00015]|uniref:hypothetical protein n=1 Tax=unclassified Streptomyces TaxID=2593676 RepID=UPI0022522BC9|nr:hypothetical protein [Streptomyces sp. NBC_00103]MCX5370188.1 hypothetical protein [Streptomyces sp. NBC_00103]